MSYKEWNQGVAQRRKFAELVIGKKCYKLIALIILKRNGTLFSDHCLLTSSYRRIMYLRSIWKCVNFLKYPLINHIIWNNTKRKLFKDFGWLDFFGVEGKLLLLTRTFIM